MREQGQRCRHVRRALAVGVAVLLGMPAISAAQSDRRGQEHRKPKGEVTDHQDAVDVKFAGMQVSIDPATGKIRQPTPAEARAMADALRRFLKRSSDDLPAQVAADGTLSMDLRGGFLNLSLVTLDEDGTLSMDCLTSLDEAATRLALPGLPAPAPAPSVESRQGGVR